MPEDAGGLRGGNTSSERPGQNAGRLEERSTQTGREEQGAGNARCDRWTRPGLPGFVSDQSLEMRMHDWQRPVYRSRFKKKRKRGHLATARLVEQEPRTCGISRSRKCALASP